MISSMLLESPWMLSAVWMPTQLILLVVWSRRRDNLSSRLVLGGFAFFAITLMLQAVVTTDRERIMLKGEEMAYFCEVGDFDAIRDHLSASFTVDDLDADGFVEKARSTLTRYEVDRIRLSAFDVKFPSPDQSITMVTVSGNVAHSEFSQRIAVRLKLTLRLEGDRWTLTSLDVVPMKASPIGSLHELLR